MVSAQKQDYAIFIPSVSFTIPIIDGMNIQI